jgi:maltooligosyltrehalose trehalohydrolase
MHNNVGKRTLGLNFTATSSADVLVWAPYATTVAISLRSKYVPLNRTDKGYWIADSLEVNAGDLYRFVIDGKNYPDPASLSQPEGVHGPSQAVNLNSFAWTDSTWKGVLPEDLVIYELHTGTFSDAGTFDGVLEKLEYLKDLGITAIELMPVAQFPGSRNWGYDGVFPFAVQNSYGGFGRLQKLVDSCHRENIAIILDVVYNHLGPEGNYFAAFGPYFTDKYKTPWGEALNYDDQWSDEVRRFFADNAIMWLRDFHVDGLRLDAVHAMKDFGARNILEELKDNTRKLNEVSAFSHFLIAESDQNDPRIINTVEKGGYGIDLQWCDEFHHALHALVTGEQFGYYSDFGNITHLIKAYNDVFVYDGTYSHFRKRTFGNKISDMPGSKFVVFTQNHDQIGNRMLGERMPSMVDHEALKVLAAAILTSPYIPLLFMGEEYGETNPFLYFTSHHDKKLIKAVREGRKKEFAWISGKEDVPDPQSPDTFTDSWLNWENRSENQKKLLTFYKELIRIRRNHPVLKNTDRKDLKAEVVKGRNALVLRRKYHDKNLICILNFEDKALSMEVEQLNKPLFVLLDSSGDGWSTSRNTVPEGNKVAVKGKSILILSDVKVNTNV